MKRRNPWSFGDCRMSGMYSGGMLAAGFGVPWAIVGMVIGGLLGEWVERDIARRHQAAPAEAEPESRSTIDCPLCGDYIELDDHHQCHQQTAPARKGESDGA